ncbi:MAG: OmpA family protein [Bacteroidota bacterium]|nr:OmpA family protein [Bacteroidota bacterium]
MSRILYFCALQFPIALLPLYAWAVLDSTQQDSVRHLSPPDERMDIRIGGFLGGSYTRARVHFYELFNLSGNKTPFIEGNGYGGTLGFLIELPVTPWLHFGARATVLQQSHTLRAIPEIVPVGTLDGNSDIGKFQRTLDAQLASAGMQFFLALSPTANLNIFLGARTHLTFWKQYYQVERLLEPSYGRFVDGLPAGFFRTRNELSGEIPIVRALGIANFSLALMTGIGYELPINASRSLTLAPEVFGAYGLTNVVIWYTSLDRDSFWKLDNAQAQLTLRWYPARAARFDAEAYQLQRLQALEKEIAQERRRIQMELRELRSSGLSAKITTVKGITAHNATDVLNPTVRVEEFRAERSIQLLPYIFFNENSSVIPGRYKRLTANDRANFRLEALERMKPIEIYYTILNIIGKRMEMYPSAILTVTGCTSGSEQGNQRLSEQRAQAISDYLQDVWKIPARRIIVQKRDLPERPSHASSTLTSEEAHAENRRVELSSSSPELLAPLTVQGMQLTVDPPTLVLGLNILAGSGLKQWSLEINTFEGREERLLHGFIGGNTYPENYIWNIDADQRSIPLSPGSMDIRLSATDVDNREVEAPIISVPVEVRRYTDKKRTQSPDKKLVFYTLVFSDNHPQTEAILQSIRARLTPQSQVALDSYSHTGVLQQLSTVLGVQNTRLQLSTEARNRILSLLQCDATLPEGRFFNRAVYIEFQEPLQ